MVYIIHSTIYIHYTLFCIKSQYWIKTLIALYKRTPSLPKNISIYLNSQQLNTCTHALVVQMKKLRWRSNQERGA